MIPAKFEINWPFCSGEEEKNKCSEWPPSALLDFRPQRFYLFLIYKSNRCLQPSYNWSFGSGEEEENIYFQVAAMIFGSERFFFFFFCSLSHLDAFFQVSGQLAQG